MALHPLRASSLLLSLACLAPLACSKTESAKATADSDAASAAKPKRFDLEPLGTVPTVDTSEPVPPDPEPTAVAAGSPSSAASASAKGAASAAPIAVTSTASVKLLDAGAEPRAKLRYKLKVGHSEAVQIDLLTTATVEAQGQQQQQKIPPIRIALAIDPKSVSPEGDLRYEYRVVNAEVTTDASAPAQLVAPLRAGLDGMRGLTGWAVITSRGVTKDASFPAPRGTSQATMQIMEQIKQTARDLAAPFPDEAVGKGAKWEKTTKVDARGAKATQKETYTLVDLTGDTGKLDVVTALSAPGAASPGEPIRLENMTSAGKGHSAFDLAHLAPRSDLDATTTMNLAAEDESGASQKIKMITRGIVKVMPSTAQAGPSGAAPSSAAQ